MDEVEAYYGKRNFSKEKLRREVKYRKRLISAVESYLMANRGIEVFSVFKEQSSQLAASTLAYTMADDQQRLALVGLFELVADRIQAVAPEPEKQALYSKTLLGVDGAKAVEAWTDQNIEKLIAAETNDELVITMWSLFATLLDDKFFHKIEPLNSSVELTKEWGRGTSYCDLFEIISQMGVTKPWGNQRRRLSQADILDFLENTIGFECAILVAAVGQFLKNNYGYEMALLDIFQKTLKYGIPDPLSISCFERGFPDRMIATRIKELLNESGYFESYVGSAFTLFKEEITDLLKEYPSYYESAFKSLHS